MWNSGAKRLNKSTKSIKYKIFNTSNFNYNGYNTLFWSLMSCILLEIYWCCRVICCLQNKRSVNIYQTTGCHVPQVSVLFFCYFMLPFTWPFSFILGLSLCNFGCFHVYGFLITEVLIHILWPSWFLFQLYFLWSCLFASYGHGCVCLAFV